MERKFHFAAKILSEGHNLIPNAEKLLELTL